jgi:acetolactate synthase-1/3 small subunit
VRTTEEGARKVVEQLEKQVEVFKALYFNAEELIHQEVAMYKLKLDGFSKNNSIEKIIRQYNARIIDVEPEFVVVEMTGHKAESQELFEKLQPFGVLQFVRSGRIAIMKPMKTLAEYMKEIEENFTSTLK